MEDNITEKFALLNLIKALQGFSAPNTDTEKSAAAPPATAPSPPHTAQRADGYNAMASVLERHEAISNRVKNRK